LWKVIGDKVLFDDAVVESVCIGENRV
jgi:hypothetical protein